eukprot:5701256-Pleurochrysis_carterae.AAC.2
MKNLRFIHGREVGSKEPCVRIRHRIQGPLRRRACKEPCTGRGVCTGETRRRAMTGGASGMRAGERACASACSVAAADADDVGGGWAIEERRAREREVGRCVGGARETGVLGVPTWRREALRELLALCLVHHDLRLSFLSQLTRIAVLDGGFWGATFCPPAVK